MKLKLFIAVCIFIPFLNHAQNSKKMKMDTAEPNKSIKEKLELKNFEDSVAYLFGNDVADFLINSKINIDMNLFVKGLLDWHSGDKYISMAKRQEILGQYQEKQRAILDAENAKIAEANAVKGREFLENNKKQKGVKVTNSGLQYLVIQEGKGEKPKQTDKVTVHYTGTLIDGTKFDSSLDTGKPVTFPLNQVIKGWTEGLQLMTIGSKYRFFIPSELGYGPNGMRTIPGNSVLIFDVELIAIEAPQQ